MGGYGCTLAYANLLEGATEAELLHATLHKAEFQNPQWTLRFFSALKFPRKDMSTSPSTAASRSGTPPASGGLRDRFDTLSKWCAEQLGSPWAFVAAILVTILWAASGPYFHYSDTWQLVINTGTTVLTFLAVFVIQNTQNRDGKAIQLKLDELIRAVEGARNHFVDIENCTNEEIERISTEIKLHRESMENPK